MPKRIERQIAAEYRRKGYSPKRARSIAIATMIKKHIWTPTKRGRKGKHKR